MQTLPSNSFRSFSASPFTLFFEYFITSLSLNLASRTLPDDDKACGKHASTVGQPPILTSDSQRCGQREREGKDTSLAALKVNPEVAPCCDCLAHSPRLTHLGCAVMRLRKLGERPTGGLGVGEGRIVFF